VLPTGAEGRFELGAGVNGDFSGGGAVDEDSAADGGPGGEHKCAGGGELFIGGEGAALLVGDDQEERALLWREGEIAVFVGGGVVGGIAVDIERGEGISGIVDIEPMSFEKNDSVGDRRTVGIEELGGEGRGFFEGERDFVVVAIERESGGIAGKIVRAGKSYCEKSAVIGIREF